MKSIMGMLVFLAFTLTAFAADDPSIKGEKRRAIQIAMQEHIDHNTVNGHYVLYDAVTDDLLKLKLAKLHDGLVKKADYYVIEKDGKVQALQGIVHKVGDVKRKYHLES